MLLCLCYLTDLYKEPNIIGILKSTKKSWGKHVLKLEKMIKLITQGNSVIKDQRTA